MAPVPDAQRRRFLQLLASGSLLAVLPGLGHARPAQTARYLTARQHAGRQEAVVLDATGRELKILPLPARGHSFAIDKVRQRAVVFGRQPGFFALAFSLEGDTPTDSLPLPEDRHYFGHGIFSADGQRLYTTENDFDGSRGVIGIYDARPGQHWRRLGEFDSHGIGPHEVLLLPDGKTLCVANGGILTHPDYGKLELNLESMQPSLVYLEAASGKLLEKRELAPELHQLSIRHLALDGQGSVWFGCQYSGPASDQPPLVGCHRRGEPLQLFSGPADTLRELRGYIGSVSVDDSGQVIATSSPVGGLVCYWQAGTGRFLGSTARPDGCGVAPAGPGHFLISDGFGHIVRSGPGQAAEALQTASDLAWDNHFRRI